MGVPNGTFLKVVKPLYIIPESGLNWYPTYLDHHLFRLSIFQSHVDSCFLMKKILKGGIEGAVIIQVDDSLITGSEDSMKLGESEAKKFLTKPRTPVTRNTFQFNSINIVFSPDGEICIDTTDKIKNLKHAISQKDFGSQRAASQYIFFNLRSDICANLQLIAPGA